MTRPYGNLLNWQFARYKKRYVEKGQTVEKHIPILLFTSAVAKRLRTKRQPETNPQEATEQSATQQPLRLKVPTKVVPIVCDSAAEPWCLDLLYWIKAQKNEQARAECFRFNCTEMTVQNVVKRCLSGLKELDPKIKKIHPHFLRHCRITHLIKAYDFTPYQITAFTGWSMKSTFQQMGVQASSNIDIYSHLEWKDYIDKLLTPLADVI